MAELKWTSNPISMIPAAPGWQAVVSDRDGAPFLVPVVAWALVEEVADEGEPTFRLLALDDDYVPHRSIEPVIVHAGEPDAVTQRQALERYDLSVLTLLEPGEDPGDWLTPREPN